MPTVDEVVRDPEFQGLPWGERHKVLSTIDPDYASLGKGEQAKALNGLKQQPFWQGGGGSTPQPTAQPQPRSALDKVVDYVARPPERPKSLSEFVTNSLPRSAANTLYGIAANSPILGGYKAVKSVRDAVVNPQSLEDNFNNAVGTLKGIVAPFGLAGKENFKEAWSTAPVQSALAVIPAVAGIRNTTRAMTPAARANRSISGNYAAIDESINKAIRPGVEGKRTFSQQESFKGNAREAVKNIVMNRDKLQLTDEFGEVVQGLPKNLRQFSQAIDQSKKQIYQQYNDMAKAADGRGATIDLNPIAAELNNVASKKVLSDLAPETVVYAQKRAKALGDTGVYTADQAQEAIAMLNNSLEAFYKNPSPGTASKAYIDSMIVNNIRRSLDDSIEQLSGPGYQSLKRAYGSLKAVERDVNRRAVVDARRNAKGLIDFTDVFTGGQVVNGIMTMNPGAVAQGAAGNIIARLYRMKNDPNRAVANAFKRAERVVSPSKKKQ